MKIALIVPSVRDTCFHAMCMVAPATMKGMALSMALQAGPAPSVSVDYLNVDLEKVDLRSGQVPKQE